jgi:hypothetical protein
VQQKAKRAVVTLCAAALANGCGHVASLRPAPVHQVQWEASLGGPIVFLGAPIPLPLATAGAAYGLTERVDVSAHAHLTPLFFGVLGADVGTTVLAWEQKALLPALAATGRLYGFESIHGGGIALAELTPAMSWQTGGKFLSYLAPTALAQLGGGPVLWSIGVGEQLQLGISDLQLELRWYEPNVDTRFVSVRYAGVAGRGGLGIVLGFHTRLGGGN